MKKNMIKTVATTLVAGMLLFGGCTKEGPTGPAGMAGPKGNANVTSVNLTATWTWDATNQWAMAAWANISILTGSVNDNGAVMLYELDGTTPANTWKVVPYTRIINSTIHEYVHFTYTTGTLTVYAKYSDNSNPGFSGGTYKLICIPPAMIKPNVNMNNYNAVKAAYKLPD